MGQTAAAQQALEALLALAVLPVAQWAVLEPLAALMVALAALPVALAVAPVP